MNSDIAEAIVSLMFAVLLIWLSCAACYESYRNSKRKEKK